MVKVDFLQPGGNRDFALLVEGTKVYVNREFLATYSTVLHKIFYPEGAPFEQPEGGMLMKDKKLDDFLTFLNTVFPTSDMMKVNESNLAVLVAYADEYDVDVLQERCAKFMGKQLNKGDVDDETLINYLCLASTYNLKGLQKQLVPLVAQLPLDKITAANAKLPLSVLSAVYQSKALTLQTALDGDGQPALPEGAYSCGCCDSETCSITKGASSCCNEKVWILATAAAQVEALCSFTCTGCSKPCSLKAYGSFYHLSSCCTAGLFVHPKSAAPSKPLSAAAIAKAADFSADLLNRNQ